MDKEKLRELSVPELKQKIWGTKGEEYKEILKVIYEKEGRLKPKWMEE